MRKDKKFVENIDANCDLDYSNNDDGYSSRPASQPFPSIRILCASIKSFQLRKAQAELLKTLNNPNVGADSARDIWDENPGLKEYYAWSNTDNTFLNITDADRINLLCLAEKKDLTGMVFDWNFENAFRAGTDQEKIQIISRLLLTQRAEITNIVKILVDNPTVYKLFVKANIAETNKALHSAICTRVEMLQFLLLPVNSDKILSFFMHTKQYEAGINHCLTQIKQYQKALGKFKFDMNQNSMRPEQYNVLLKIMFDVATLWEIMGIFYSKRDPKYGEDIHKYIGKATRIRNIALHFDQNYTRTYWQANFAGLHWNCVTYIGHPSEIPPYQRHKYYDPHKRRRHKWLPCRVMMDIAIQAQRAGQNDAVIEEALTWIRETKKWQILRNDIEHFRPNLQPYKPRGKAMPLDVMRIAWTVTLPRLRWLYDQSQKKQQPQQQASRQPQQQLQRNIISPPQKSTSASHSEKKITGKKRSRDETNQKPEFQPDATEFQPYAKKQKRMNESKRKINLFSQPRMKPLTTSEVEKPSRKAASRYTRQSPTNQPGT